MTRRFLLMCAIASLSGCSGGSSGVSEVQTTSVTPRALGSQTGGGSAAALAASLLASAGHAPARALEPVFATDAAAAARLRFHALAHLEVTAFAGAGPTLVGSARIRGLALDPAAPPDANGSGSNLDEVLTAELASIAGLAGADDPFAGAIPTLFPWQEVDARLAGDPSGAERSRHEAWRLVPVLTRTIDLEQIGHALHARVIAAAGLLPPRRGNSIGASPESGALGLALLEQAMAIDQTLLASLFFDGTTMAGLEQPLDYDPGGTSSPVWLPRTIEVIEEPGLPGAPAGYVPGDRASQLAALAVMLRAASELAWLASDRNPYGELRDVFARPPFGVPGAGGLDPTDGEPPSFTRDIQPLVIGATCTACHFGPIGVSEFSLSTYEQTLRGGALAGPAVIPGDAANSPLSRAVKTGLPPLVQLMPLGGMRIPQEQIDLIDAWIDAGAPKDPTTPREVAPTGLALATVLFRNLEALHADPSGDLHHRFVIGAGPEPSRHVDARSTGLALSALRSFRFATLDGADVLPFAERVALAAIDRLTTAGGAVFGGWDLDAQAPTGAGDLAAHAALTAGLVAIGRALGSPGVLERGRLLGAALVTDWFDAETGLFVTAPGARSHRFTPELTAVVLDALRELAADGVVDGARQAHDRFLEALLPSLVFAEFDGLGEILDDGIADTDGNGIAEPGAVGRAPLFAGVVVAGEDAPPSASTGVTWSRHVLPLFRRACVGCHVDGAQLGGYRVDTLGLAATPGQSQLPSILVPGDPEGSILYRKLADRLPPVGEQMPLGQPPLNARGLALVREWILGGAKAR